MNWLPLGSIWHPFEGAFLYMFWLEEMAFFWRVVPTLRSARLSARRLIWGHSACPAWRQTVKDFLNNPLQQPMTYFWGYIIPLHRKNIYFEYTESSIHWKNSCLPSCPSFFFKAQGWTLASGIRCTKSPWSCWFLGFGWFSGFGWRETCVVCFFFGEFCDLVAEVVVSKLPAIVISFVYSL